MSRWEEFRTAAAQPGALAEDQPRLTSAEDYAMFQEEVFNKVSQRVLVLPVGLSPEKFSRVVVHPVMSIRNHTLRRQRITYAYHGFGGAVRYGSVVLIETTNPRGYNVIDTWMGGVRYHKWISWRDAVTGMY